ncbi:MAG: MFS transporter [Fimbriimonadales bacterium]|nr:MAG: MFS transporter [Fimbriimonadales bacterium]
MRAAAHGRINYWALSAFWLGVSVHWAAFLTIAMQARVNDLAPPDQRGVYLAWLAAAGALISTVIELVAGPISDRCTARLGRRRPFILWGTLLSLPFVVLFMTTQSFALLILHFVAIQLFLNWANGPYQAVIPDYVPPQRHGLASAYMGMMTLVGTLLGLALAGALLGEPPLIGGQLERGARLQIVGYTLVGFLLLTMLWTVLGMREPQWQPRTPDEKRLRWTLFVNILLNEQPNFRWVVLSRFVFNMGFFTALFFLEFYLRDTIGLKGASPQHAFGFMATATLTGVLGNWLAGALADRMSKKRIIYGCIALICVCAVMFLTAQNLMWVYLTGALFGMAWGAYAAVDWALASNLAPPQESGRYMAIWHIAMTMPQVIAPLIAGPLGDYWNAQYGLGAGWRWIFALAPIYFLASAFLLRPVREVPLQTAGNPSGVS